MKNIISKLREKNGWSQEELARKVNVSRQTINAIEKERYDPSLPLAFKLSITFNLSLEEIFQYQSNLNEK
ncbi:helix-turn-helix transcriptional regulator [Acinetobacter ursingii]|uniref:helix-turn-helix transcriptional regulator n=1 Tax=Acinetobacter ursingii TaxID=108980 RepID=UPI000CAF425F|nr:helix-turn-helix transcriptional regulator [Acinetobacter ursingii]MCU4352927.1 helix-turn-helix transcriptional regulator [Acinetobacter ursingii]MDI3239766.1 helix-turn-helix transcriptional regulator [Acinetobacter ursingii]PMC98069.1 transcriptional regulator [Acinetobacter ursingii]PPZ93198.1 transcriptional regulator [Acinetobacter ursingii]